MVQLMQKYFIGDVMTSLPPTPEQKLPCSGAKNVYKLHLI